MIEALFMSAAIAGAAPPDSQTLAVSATLGPEPLLAGSEGAIAVELVLAEGWSAADAGIPRPLLQIEVPDSVELTGKRIETFAELARNDFINEPYERVLEIGSGTIGFKLSSEPEQGDVIALNVLSYLREGDSDEAYFLRQRLHLPLKSGAEATPADAAVSTWSGSESGLQIGAEATDFQLPRADGTTVSLSDFKGKSNVIVTTYRAFW